MAYDHPHRRLNPLLGEWVLVSPHRAKRPWQGARETLATDRRPAYDPTCYLCAGNTRANGEVNPPYRETFVFTNDFSAILPETPALPETVPHPLYRAEKVQGECRVICFSPRHDLTLAQMQDPELEKVVDVWVQQYQELGSKYRWVQVFENKGAAMGCSNPHPHGQVWASDAVPSLVAREDQHQTEYFRKTGEPLLAAVAHEELRSGERIVEETAEWVAFVPYWAVWPFELMVLPKKAVPRMTDLSSEARQDLAEVLRRVLIRYDNLFETEFPYSMGWHPAPGDAEVSEAWVLHAHLYPPLLRSATVRKFMVGYEMLAEAQRDLTPEQAAARLRDLPSRHYLET